MFGCSSLYSVSDSSWGVYICILRQKKKKIELFSGKEIIQLQLSSFIPEIVSDSVEVHGMNCL